MNSTVQYLEAIQQGVNKLKNGFASNDIRIYLLWNSKQQ